MKKLKRAEEALDSLAAMLEDRGGMNGCTVVQLKRWLVELGITAGAIRAAINELEKGEGWGDEADTGR